MEREAAVLFFTRLMQGAQIGVRRFFPPDIPEYDLGLRKSLGLDPTAHLPAEEEIRSNTIYMLKDSFSWRYILLRLPQSEEVMLAGPYLSEGLSDQTVMSIMEARHLAPALFSVVRRFYSSVPLLSDESMLMPALNALGEMLWGGQSAFSLELIDSRHEISFMSEGGNSASIPQDSREIELIEMRYEIETKLMYAIAHGQTHQASAILSAIHPDQMEQRTANPLRNLKNYAIISNTLFRKAAQQGSVHPYYIDQLSSTLGRRIEETMTIEEVQQLMNSMVHKYCLLVKNHNMKGYSPPVQSVILRTDSEIAGDLSLRAHAAHIGINASYLSSLFKKETGVTLTDYVNQRRIDYAIFLLNSTDMQVQTIAQHCGMPDVNYFTRTFRRLTGKTPTEYRHSVLGHI